MTTVFDPLGSPVVAFNRSGKNIQNIVANAGDTFGDAVSISHVSERTLLLVDVSGGGGFGAVAFDPDFDLGDEVTISWFGGSGLTVYNSNGTSMGSVNSSPNPYNTFTLIDTGSQLWRKVG